MTVILTNKGEQILIDDDYYNYLNMFKWRVHNKKGYVVCNLSRKEGHKVIFLHRLITLCPDDKVVDHINMNKLDNRKENLRITTHQYNMANCNPRKNRKYKGVYKQNNKWAATISHNGKTIYLKSCKTPEEAAEAYNIKAIELFGEFARLNNIEGVI